MPLPLGGKCTLYKQDTKNSSVDNVCCIFFKVTTFLWIILILHPSHTSLFLETVIMKFGGPRAEGREKQIPNKLPEFNKRTNTETDVHYYFLK